MAGLRIKQSGRLFLSNGSQSNFARDFGEATSASNWIRPSVHHTNFSHPSAMLQYVAEYTHWDGNHPIPPFWSPTLRASGNSDFVMTIIDVNP